MQNAQSVLRNAMISDVLRARVRLQANRHIGKLNVAQVSTLAGITKAASAAGSEKLAKLALVSILGSEPGADLLRPESFKTRDKPRKLRNLVKIPLLVIPKGW